ncbi:MAG: hypothetical protein P8P83_04645 [Rickettsiaceae bacterium]|nr:hypothetical protein [Rickettsiaceae bacterium]
MIKKFTLLALFVTLSGCATIFTSAHQQLTVNVVDQDGQHIVDHGCMVYPTNGAAYQLGGNPATISVSRADGGLKFICHKKGYHQVQQGSEKGFNSVTLVNIFFWPGFIVDGLSGAYQQHNSNVRIQMNKK